MIDLDRERLVPLADVPARLPPTRRGKKIHLSAVYRWTTRGLAGVKLETLQVGGRRCTSLEALQRFFTALSAHKGLADHDRDPRRSPTKRQRDHERADRRLAEGGW